MKMYSLVRLVGSSLLAGALCVLPQVAAAADATAAPMRTVARFIAAVDGGKMVAADAAFSADAELTDDFAPFHWSGPHVVRAWFGAFGKLMAAAQITKPSISVAAATFPAIAGTHAYLPLPTTFTFEQHGTAMKESGMLIFSLDRTAAGWKIASMAWGRSR